MSSIDFLQIGHGQQSDARMVVERDVTDSQRIELAAVHRHLFYAVYWIHEGRGIHSIDFWDYEIRPDRVFLVRPEQVHVMRPEGAMRYSALQFTEEYFHLYAKKTLSQTAYISYKPRVLTYYSDIGKYQTEVIKAKRKFETLHWAASITRDAEKKALYQDCINKLNFVYTHISKK